MAVSLHTSWHSHYSLYFISFMMIRCPPFLTPENSRVSAVECDGTVVVDIGQTCIYGCKPGYVFRDIFGVNVTAICSRDKTWTYSVATSLFPLVCMQPCLGMYVGRRVTASALCTSDEAFFDSVCSFTCTAPLELIGSPFSVCGLDGMWSDKPPVCAQKCAHAEPAAVLAAPSVYATPINCALDDDPFGSAVLAETICRYACDPVYVPSGSLERRCLSTGLFDNPFPVCGIPAGVGAYSASRCEAAPTHPQSVGRLIKVEPCTYGTLNRLCAMYGCDIGYKIIGNGILHCIADSYRWGTPPLCKRICPDISATCSGKIEGEDCVVTCTGTEALALGINRIFCQADGSWSGELPHCVDKNGFRIGVPLIIAPATVSTPYCMVYTGRRADDPSVDLTECSTLAASDRNALWSWEGPYLLRHTGSSYCLAAESMAHGARIIVKECNLLDQLQQWKCSADARIPYLVTLRFEDHFLWEASQTVTSTLADGVRLVHTNSLLEITDALANTVIDVTNYPPSVSWLAIDEASPGVLTKTLCSSHLADYLCPPLSAAIPTGGSMTPPECVDTWSPLNKACQFDCSTGFTRNATSATDATCQDDGIWDTISFLCEIACNTLTAPDSGSITCSPEPVPIEGSTCDFTCNADYELLGYAKRVCQWDGYWSGKDVVCAQRCPLLPVPDNGMVSPSECFTSTTGVLPSTICLYSCFEEFRISDGSTPSSSLDQSVTRSCQNNASWSGNAITCERVCPSQVNPDDGKIEPITCVTGNSISGFECKVVCDEGFAVFGNDTRTCGADGAWRNSVTSDLGPPCRIQCVEIPVILDGEISCSLDGDAAAASLNVKGTRCNIGCMPGFGISQGSSLTRFCQTDGSWSGKSPLCIEELQFGIFLQRTSKASDTPHICLVAGEGTDVVSKISHTKCLEVTNLRYRWSWYETWKLKNAATGRCLAAERLDVGEKLITRDCNADLDPTNTGYDKWSCIGAVMDGTAWFLRLSESDYFPDFGYAYSSNIWLSKTDTLNVETDEVHWYARAHLDDGFTKFEDVPPTTVCAQRKTRGICPPLTDPKRGIVHPRICSESEYDIVAGTKCAFECDVGYRLNGGLHTVICQPNGVWSGLVPRCSILCQSLAPIPHGRISPATCAELDIDLEVENEILTDDRYLAGVLHGESCSYECDDGWLLVDGPAVVTCLGNGQWNSLLPMCKRLCPRFTKPDHSSPLDGACLSGDKVEGEVCSFRCDEGFGVPRAKSFNCTNDTMSTLLADTNTGDMFCELPDAETEEFEEEEEEAEGETEKEDKRAYDIAIHLTCSNNGSWLGSDPVCFPLCQPISQPENGVVEPKECSEEPQVVGTRCKYICNPFYMLRRMEDDFTCIVGKWIATETVIQKGFDIALFGDDYKMTIPACDKYCPAILEAKSDRSTVIPTQCVLGRNRIGTLCVIDCESDYVLKGNVQVECMEDGSWDAQLGSCLRKCPALLEPDFGDVTPRICTTAHMADGAICTFKCLDKYALTGAVTTACDSKGNWTSVPPQCKRRCLPLPRFYNGYAEPITSCFTEHIMKDEMCSFRCEDGFLLVGNPVLTCLESGDWDHPPPTCNKICNTPRIDNGGFTCTIRGQKIPGYMVGEAIPTWGSSCTVECDTRYAPTQTSRFICRNEGRWRPAIPRCEATGVPMYILQKRDSTALCLVENEDERTVLHRPQEQCLKQTDYASSAAWHWLGKFNIQNARTGRCIYVRALADGELLRTEPCDTDSALQQWDCSIHNAFQLILRGTDYAPTTFYESLGDVVLQRWSDSHSYYSTFDLVTLAHSSLCSRRPGSVCPPLTDIDGGRVIPEDECKATDIEAGLQCLYECDNNGIVVNGEDYTVCMGNGIWSNPPPICSEYCDPLDALPDNAFVFEDECVFYPVGIDKSCTVMCMEGFDITGNGTVTCTAPQTWSTINFECKPICPTIFGLLNGEVNPKPCTSNTCKFSCHAGYVLSGASGDELQCNDGGQWSDIIPKCIRDAQFRIYTVQSSNQRDICLTVPKDDTLPVMKRPCTSPDIHDGSQLFKWRDNEDLILHPASGLCLRGSQTRYNNVTLDTCNPSAPFQNWECGDIAGVTENSLRLKNTEFYLDAGAAIDVFSSFIDRTSSLHNVIMEDGYYETSQWFARHHYADGTVCSLREYGQCYPLPDTADGEITPPDCQNLRSLKKGVICKVECDDGFAIQQTDRTTCSPRGTWTLPIPVCTGIYQCSGIISQDEALITRPLSCMSKSVPEGVICYFQCHQDHHLVGEKTIRCETLGTWSGTVPKCMPQCGALQYVPGAQITPFGCYSPNNNPSTTCTIECLNNYRLVGSKTRNCRKDGSWSGEEAICVGFCSAVEPPTSGNVFPDRCKKNENYEENTCTFRCNDGFVLLGNEDVTCKDGEWDREIPQCVPGALCEKIESGVEGVKEAFYRNLVKDVAVGNGTSVTFTCKVGFTSNSGEETRLCLETGQWESGTPRCIASCAPLLPTSQATMVPNHCGWRYQAAGSGCMVRCKPGWSLPTGTNAVVQCEEDGKWSDPTPECTGGSIVEPTQNPFVLRQIIRRFNRQVCLKVNFGAKLVEITQDCPFETSVANEYQWQWRNLEVGGLIQSVQNPNWCLAPKREETYILLAVASCNVDKTEQHFVCGDVTLRQYALNLGMHELWLGSKDEEEVTDQNLYLIKAAENDHMDWEAFSVADVIAGGGLKTNVNASVENSACNQMCGGLLESDEGLIKSPGYPNRYPNNVVCLWTINVPDRIIRIWISNIDIEPGRDGGSSECNRDSLTIVEGETTASDSSHSLATICGRVLNPVGPIISYLGTMIITFKSDNSKSKSNGFQATWLSEAYPTTLTTCHNSQRATDVANNVSLAGRLVGGKRETIDKVPWQAALFENDDSFQTCGAVIISDRYAISAGHCVDHVTTYEELENIIIAFGASDLWRLSREVGRLRQSNAAISMVENEDGTKAHRLEDIYIHPEFDEELNHDVVLIALKKAITWSRTVYPACLPPPDAFPADLGWTGRLHLPKTYCTLAGWGSESDDGEAVGHLESIEFPVMSDRQCTFTSANVFGRRVDNKNTICAGHFDGTRQGPCDGDEGGGLICTWNDNFYVIGITSQQLGSCTLLNAPRYFTRVAAHRNWLDDQIRRSANGVKSRLLRMQPPLSVNISES